MWLISKRFCAVRVVKSEETRFMSYNKFTIAQLKAQFGLQVTEKPGLFTAAPLAPISDWLRVTLRKQSVLALRGNSEKARSEYIIAPIMTEVYEQMQEQANLFSGTEFNVDRQKGLMGFCDFLFSLTPLTIEIEAPVVSIVETKKEDIPKGIPQCLAELIAAQIVNERAGRPIDTLYGGVTTGDVWRFLRLQGKVATVDRDLYYLDNVEKIVGILISMLT